MALRKSDYDALSDEDMADQDFEVEPERKPNVSALAAARRGLERGATFNFRDKLAGAAGAVGDWYSRNFQPSWHRDVSNDEIMQYMAQHPEVDEPFYARQALEKQLFGQPTSGEVYKQGLGEEQAISEAAKEQHPWAYGAGNAGGTLLASAGLGVLGGGAEAAGAERALADRVGETALEHARLEGLSAAGESQAEDWRGLLKDFSNGASRGAGAGFLNGTLAGAGRAAARALPGAAELAPEWFARAQLPAALRGALNNPEQIADPLLKAAVPAATAALMSPETQARLAALRAPRSQAQEEDAFYAP